MMHIQYRFASEDFFRVGKQCHMALDSVGFGDSLGRQEFALTPIQLEYQERLGG